MSADSSHLGIAIVLALVCAAIETVEQLLYRVVGRGSSRWKSRVGIATALHYLYVLVWLLLLRYVPLSTALPMMGLQYVTIALAAKMLFNERVDTRRWIGICVILFGFVLIAAHMKE